MLDKGFQIADLIVAYIMGEISREDLEILDTWIAKSDTNKALFVSFMDEAVFQKERTGRQGGNLDIIFGDIKKRRQQKLMRRQRRWISGMAATIVIALGIWWFVEMPENVLVVAEEQPEITVGQQKAWLLLASGEKIELKAFEKDTICLSQYSSRVIVDNGQVQIDGGMGDSMEKTYNVMEVPRGGEYRLTLSDGTKVWLNADSKLKFPGNFKGDRRYVELTGEAYFQVSRDENRPFVVHANEVDVTVLGTEFCITGYTGKATLTTLVRGSVEVADRGGWKAILKPGQQSVTLGMESSVREVETLYYTAWKDGYFIFENTPLEEIMEKLSLWYNCHFFFENQHVATARLTARLKKYDEIDVLLNILSKTDDVKFEKKGNTILVRGK